MSRSRTKPRMPDAGIRIAGGFGGFAAAQSKSGLAYLTDRSILPAISDANVAVSFKNLTKKDATTRAKALEDLVAHVKANPYERDGGVSETVLDAWLQFYPRLSIDDSRKVRELSHTLQYELVKSARKRAEKHIPKVVGPWLAGTYDRDRVVSRAAADGLAFLLDTDQKALILWRRCQPQILEYAAAALKETPTTLSDMRFTSKDDADFKYNRVIFSTISLVLALLQKLTVADTDKGRDQLDQILSAKAVWSSALSSDVQVRRVAHALFLECLTTRPLLLESRIPQLAKLMIDDVPNSHQAGSTVDYLRALTQLTKSYPNVWAEKDHALVALRPLFERGLQGSAPATLAGVWLQLDALLAVVPPRDFALSDAGKVLTAFRNGIHSRDEPLDTAIGSWTAYLSLVRRLVDAVSPQNERTQLVKDNVFPLFAHFFQPLNKSAWSTAAQVPIVTRASLLSCRSAYPDIVEAAREEWAGLSRQFATRLSNSLPEVSTNFEQSQKATASEADRWFAVVADIHHSVQDAQPKPGSASNLVEDVVREPTIELVRCAASLLTRRNYKPVGAAHLVERAFLHGSHLLQHDAGAILSSLFPTEPANKLLVPLSSPSAVQLLSALHHAANASYFTAEQYENIFEPVLLLLKEVYGGDVVNSGIDTPVVFASLLIKDAPIGIQEMNKKNEVLQKFFVDACYDIAYGKKPDTVGFFDTALSSNAMSESSKEQLTHQTVSILGTGDLKSVLTALSTIANHNAQLLTNNLETNEDLALKLFREREKSQDPSLLPKFDQLESVVSSQLSGKGSIVKILQEHLDTATEHSLAIATLVERATDLAETAMATEKEHLFPDTNVWISVIRKFLQDGLNPSLSLCSALGGAYYLVGASQNASFPRIERDRHGASIAARMAAYVTELLQHNVDLSDLPQGLQVELMYLLLLMAEIGSDQVAMANNHSFWGDLADSSVMSSAVTSITAMREAVATFVARSEGAPVAFELATTMVKQTRSLTPLAVYSARALSSFLQTKVDQLGFSSKDEEFIKGSNLWRSTPETALGAVAVLSAYGDSLAAARPVSNFCNQLISDIAIAKADQEESTLRTLVLFNACASIYADSVIPAATNRVIFATKQIMGWFVEEEAGTDGDGEVAAERSSAVDPRLASESCRALQHLLPSMKDMYGPHWARCIKLCTGLWTQAPHDDSDARLPYVHASLKLLNTLKTMEDPNDDLQDALKASGDELSRGMIALLLLPRGSASQPQQMVDGLLSRMAAGLLDRVEDLSGLYGLLASESRDIQKAGFSILDRALPAAQAELSVEAVLDSKVGRLPDELLSLIVEAPTLDAYTDKELCSFPAAVRCFLLSWCVIFDSMAQAADALRSQYSSQLGKTADLAALLDFAADVLGHSAAQPLNLGKEGLNAKHITGYDIDAAEGEPDEKNMHWLLVHLYYRCLRYLPQQFKAWFVACRSRQTKAAVTAWTEKYFSAIVIDEMLDSVAEWAQGQEEPSGDEKPLEVKVSKSGREVTASSEVDDMEASIVVRIPQTYPVDSITVETGNRVGVSEKRWQSWLMIMQGVISFSNGNIIDGLMAFRRNLSGALKGHTECAICYSVISAEKRTPDKRCGTCKNMFHGYCLYKWFHTSNQNTCPLCRNPIKILK